MIVKTFRVKRELGNKNDKKVLLRCDGCGKEFEMFDSAFKVSQRRHQNLHLCFSCSNKGQYKKSPNGASSGKFKNGLSPNGYRRIYYKGENRLEHRVMAENKLGRRLVGGEEVHHIDLTKLNNSVDNLFIFESRRKHRRAHYEMELLALSLLNRKVWFDAINGVYKTSPPQSFTLEKKYGIKNNSVNVDDIIPSDRKVNSKRRYIYRKGCPRAIHLYIMEKIIGRNLYHNEVVHHVNGNIFDNSVNNLYVCNRSEHKVMHESLGSCVAELYREGIVGFNVEKGNYFLIDGTNNNV